MSIISRINSLTSAVRAGGSFVSNIAQSIVPGLSRPTTQRLPPVGMPPTPIKGLSRVGRKPYADPAGPEAQGQPQAPTGRGTALPPRQAMNVLYRMGKLGASATKAGRPLNFSSVHRPGDWTAGAMHAAARSELPLRFDQGALRQTFREGSANEVSNPLSDGVVPLARPDDWQPPAHG